MSAEDKKHHASKTPSTAALASLSTLKAGEKVTIGYSVDEKGAPKAAIDIKAVPAKVAAKK